MSEVMEKSERSEEECDLIRESFGSCSDFEVKSIQAHRPENEIISKYMGFLEIVSRNRINESNRKFNWEKMRVKKLTYSETQCRTG